MPNRASNPDSEKHIRRIDSTSKTKGTCRGFQVHFSRGGKLWTKFFSDALLGGKEKARRAARLHRDKLAREIPEPKSSSPIRDNATGYSFRRRKNRDGSVTEYISASARSPEGKAVRKAFRVDGDMARAVKLALDWRMAMAVKVVRSASRGNARPPAARTAKPAAPRRVKPTAPRAAQRPSKRAAAARAVTRRRRTGRR